MLTEMDMPSFSVRIGPGPVRKSYPLNGFTEWNFLRNMEKYVSFGDKFCLVEGVIPR